MSQPAERIAYLDGIRTLAIAAVIGVHWAYTYANIGRGGYVGVDVFFVLSGYIITTIIWKRRDSLQPLSFLKGRVRRLYPALVGVVVITVPAAILLDAISAKQSMLGGLFALTNVNTAVAGLDLASTEPFGLTWSLSAEWCFYLVWPFAILALRRRSARTAAALVAAAALLLYVGSLAATADWFYFGPTSRGAQMLAGAAVALAATGWSPSRRSARAWTLAAPAAVLVIAAWVFAGTSYLADAYRYAGFPLITAAACTLVLVGVAAPYSPMTRILSAPIVAALGRASYSVYLWHFIPLVILDKDEIGLPAPVVAAIGIVLTAVATWLSYTYLEKPFLKSRASEIATSARG